MVRSPQEFSPQDKKKSRFYNQIITVISVIGLILTLFIIFKAWQMGLFTDQQKLANYLNSTGVWSPIIFIIIQIIQTVIQIIPGGLTCPAGALIFGTWYGYFLNFVGIMIGSVMNFWLARRYGRKLVLALIGEKIYNKYIGYLNHDNFVKIFGFGMFFPLSPADALCMLAGLSNMSFKTFFWLLLAGKPFTLLIYTQGLVAVINFVVHLLGG